MKNFFRGIAGLGKVLPPARPERHGVEVLRDIAYTDSGMVEHTLDIYRPIGGHTDLPVLFYVHGGGFRILSKETHWLMGIAWARRGYVVVNINYRLAPAHPFPAAAQDTCSALMWTLSHVRSYGGDPDRIVYSGESAGGNLVSVLAIASCYERPEPWARAVWDTGHQPVAVIPCCAPLQISDLHRFERSGRHSQFMLDRINDMNVYIPADSEPGATDLMDPLLIFERGDSPGRPIPPFHTWVGTADPIQEDTRRLDAALRRLNVPCDVVYYTGEQHVFHVMVFRRSARECWRTMIRFANRHVGRGDVLSWS